MKPFYWLPLGLLGLQILLLYWFGQPWLCECGHVALWSGDIFSDQNSQQLLDWYSFSHVIHGILFFYALRYLLPRQPILTWLSLALMLEISWELLENTPAVIEHYRQQALAVGYTGDSILNSVSDTLMMLLGFALAQSQRSWQVLLLALGFELFTLYMVRDNLVLNAWNLVAPSQTVQSWQAELPSQR